MGDGKVLGKMGERRKYVRTTLRLYVHSSMDYKRRAVEGIGFLKGIT